MTAAAVQYGAHGELATIEGARVYLYARCEAPAARWYCVLCHQPLANRGQLEMHLEAGQHWIVVDCRRHGYEAAP
jgi:RNase P subunit RPR2